MKKLLLIAAATMTVASGAQAADLVCEVKYAEIPAIKDTHEMFINDDHIRFYGIKFPFETHQKGRWPNYTESAALNESTHYYLRHSTTTSDGKIRRSNTVNADLNRYTGEIFLSTSYSITYLDKSNDDVYTGTNWVGNCEKKDKLF